MDFTRLRTPTVRVHALITLLLGVLYAIYHVLWFGRAEAPFITPDWLVAAQLAWGFVSFAMIFLYQREDRSPVLPALYVTFTGATYSYVWFLEASRGAVRDEMVPTWWKVISGVVGVVLALEGFRQTRISRPIAQVATTRF